MITLTHTVIQASPADIARLGGWCCNMYQPFDAAVYAEAYNLDLSEINTADIESVQDAQSQLGKDFWIAVTHN